MGNTQTWLGQTNAPLAGLPEKLRHEPAMTEAIAGGAIALGDAAVAYVVAGLASLGERLPILVATPTATIAERVANDVAAFVGPGSVELFPAWDILPFERVSPEPATMARRLRVLWRLRRAMERASGEKWPPDALDDQGAFLRVVVAPVRSLLQRIMPLGCIPAPLKVSKGGSIDQGELVAELVRLGYRREYQVEHRGELAVRGGIVDVFPADEDLPVRIDLWGDVVDRLSSFDPGDQRSIAEIDSVEIFGCREVVLAEHHRLRARSLVGEEPWGRHQWERLSEGELFDGMESWLPWVVEEELVVPDLLDGSARVVLVDPRRCRDRALEMLDEEAALADALASTWGISQGPPVDQESNEQGDEQGTGSNGSFGSAADRVRVATSGASSGFPRLHVGFERLLARCESAVLSMVPVAEGPSTPVIVSSGWDPVLGDRGLLASRLAEMARDGFSVIVCSSTPGAAQRMSETLAAEGVVAPVLGGEGNGPAPSELTGAGVRVVVANLDRGFVVPGAKVAVLAEPDFTGRRRPHRPVKPRARRATGEIGFFDDLAPGDFVVHRQHGVARYAGMVTRTVNGASRDYLLLEYRGDDKLYLPSDQIDALTPYSGGESPSLNRLGGSDWQRTRARARAAVRQVAEGLVQLYRRRLQVQGHAFGPDTPWQREMEDAFAFVETPDQRRAIDEVKADMEDAKPMDRLVCGDVGFGKTEVAIRAVFKAVQDAKQAAVLVPTTLLASQHYQTFTERFSGYPVKVELLSRFLTSAQAKQVLDGLEDGTVDVVIGTHRLLGSGVKFKRLGLLVVDEEQRFGVSHKEAIKSLSESVDVLTLTASPIPRTLEMALTGIRDLSLINTPPEQRQPILTYVGEYDEAAVVEAIRRELLREGQVFFVHNWVRDIEHVAARLRALVPEARVAVAHGQMDEARLERVVLDFWERRYDVLVCTTIVESGIDMPAVNTLVVDRADRLGLGQLHQLRGRVGRAGQRAYAYLFHPPDKVLTEAAYERLRTIGEHTELGSGFKIAMRDLEIRGAGNILGEDQSGHIAAVGYDLYVQMVAEAVAELKGEQPRSGPQVTIDVPSDAHLPATYIEREDLRLEAYRRLAGVSDDEQVDDIAAEWADRFGPPPPAARALLEVARLRVQCLRTGVSEVSATAARPGQGPASWGPGKRGLIARLSPLQLAASATVRLRRLWPDAVYKHDVGQLVMPIAPGDDPAVTLAAVLRELVPEPCA